MAQTTQIVPKFSFPYVETVINDYTEVMDNSVPDTVDTTIKQVYAVTASKGIDNTWVRKSNKTSAVKTFGESNFKKFGQPLMQALHVLEQENSSAYIMRVMPENAAYANSILTIGYKVDDTSIAPSNRKFRVKLTGKSYENIITDAQLKGKLDDGAGELDAEGFKKIPSLAVRYSGRGTCGNTFSMRMTQATTYEKDYGIKIYDFEIMDYTDGLTKDYDYVGSLVTSPKYYSDTTITMINDLLLDAEIGLPPVDVYSDEERIKMVYDAYAVYFNQVHVDLEDEYATKLVSYNIPQDELDGIVPVTEANLEHYNELKKIEELIEETAEENLPSFDEFDAIFGRKVGSTELLPGIYFVEPFTPDVDTTDPSYDANDFTESDNIIDFNSAKGMILENGSNGYFDNPRTIVDPDTGETIVYTYEDELEICLNNAFSGVYDKRILSNRRMPLTIIFDANYPFSVKETIADLVLRRNSCPVRFDVGIINTLSGPIIKELTKKYAAFNDRLESIDIHNYIIKDPGTNKHITVTINYFLSAMFVNHVTNSGYHVPFVKGVTQVYGHVKDSLRPVIEDYDTDIKELLYDNRFNYFECLRENVFQRCCQNTRQKMNSDLLEENNMLILYTLKAQVEEEIQDQIYNFADESIRQTFVNTENAKYADWNGRIVKSIEFSFATSEYEFNHSILHLYVAVIFRGLTKRAIVEIDINKRQYSTTTSDNTEI